MIAASGSSWRYLYERLGEKRFQQLCGALLAHAFPDVVCYPVGQKGGGRDAVRSDRGRRFVYQVKWTNKRLRDPFCQQAQHDQATGYHQQALTLYRELGDHGGEADALNGAGETFLASGQPDQAPTCHAHALSLARQTGARYQEARAEHGLAGSADATGDLSQARQHHQHARDLFASLGIPGPSAAPAGQPGPAPAT